jgi:hypothetical protein
MANTYTLIGSVTVGSGGASTIDFTSIPQTYTDLSIKCSFRTNTGGNYDDIDMSFNGESARQWRGVYAVTTSTGSGNNTSINIVAAANGAGSTGSFFSNCDIYIAGYTSTGVKSILGEGAAENNSTTNWNVNLSANTITNSAAVTSISLYGAGSFVQYSTVYLYGIKNS